MRKVLTLLLLCQTALLCRAYGEGGFVPCDLLANLKSGEKAALLMVHFGTEMYHQQGCFLATLQIGKQVARNKTALSVCATEEGGLT